ncbi:hypothetical protein A0H81_01874 [Grifola frondosa]|uniref:Hydrophobin n=1 Tax=Grifola frondosa TaxID=5627 RepID=A0A1C7MLI3_GRIFR|nr:hypothetical protein A0H81_01874 [Grifola frondosa]
MFLVLPLRIPCPPASCDRHSLTPRDSCDTGPIQCCATTETAGSASGAAILGLLGIVIQDLSVLLGVGSLPISVIGRWRRHLRCPRSAARTTTWAA